MAPQTYLVTGASSGLGLEIVRQLAARGDKVFATVRKRKSSGTGEDYISKVEGDVTIIEGVDVMNDKVKEILQTAPALSGVSLDVIVHSAGGLGGDRAATMSRQTLENITAHQMLSTFQLNTLGPLRVQQALQPLLKSPGGKICFISTGMGSIGDNESGGLYAYRCSKSALNMLAKGMSVDLRARGIAVASCNPGMVVTDFGPGKEMMKKMGGMTPEYSCKNLIQIFDELNMETSGRFITVRRDGPPAPYPAGW